MIVVAKKHICLKRVFGIKQVGEGQITVKDLRSEHFERVINVEVGALR